MEVQVTRALLEPQVFRVLRDKMETLEHLEALEVLDPRVSNVFMFCTIDIDR